MSPYSASLTVFFAFFPLCTFGVVALPLGIDIESSHPATNPVTQASIEKGAQPGSGFTVERKDQGKAGTIVFWGEY
jgi:hypothetical protein